ncbi:MAG: polymer-forming cytoskeletal protein [Anaerolineae bacterium]|nr:polymer-forming cytoskeletal protein [Anaerolineae bacterium]MDW8070393.1 polymer-forming cytoskeletal protein [Anaerolineae bacterium]
MRNLVNAIATLTLVVLVTMAAPAYAQGSGGVAQVVLGRDVSLDSGQALESSLIALGGSVTMAPGSRIVGNLTVVGRDATIRGTVQGNVLVMGGSAYLGATSQVLGRVTVVGGRAEKEPGAQVRGAIRQIGHFNLSPFAQSVWPWVGWGLPLFIVSGWGGSSVLLGMWRLFWAVVTATGVAVIGLLVVRFLPHHATIMVETIRDATAASFGVGLLTGVIGLIIIAVLIATVCLAPLGMILILPLALATLLGWTMVGYWLGQHLMPLLSRRASPEPMIVALVGTLVLTAGQQGLMVLSGTPCLGFFFRLLGIAVWLIAAAIGLGALVLTRIGTQRYPVNYALAPQSVVASTPVPPSETFPDAGTMDEPSRRRSRRRRPGSETASQEMHD